jgi:nucleoside-triphosphatase THEP1
MLLIALEGPPGSGKTTGLVELAQWAAAQGLRVDGFAQLAVGPRASAGHGAAGYDLLPLAEGDTQSAAIPFARREAPLPYTFATEVLDQIHEELLTRLSGPDGPPDLVLLDEFGRLEAHGGGHMCLWAKLEAQQPGTVVMVVRQGMRAALERQLGRRFDRVVTVPDPGAVDQLRALVLEQRDWSRVGVFGAGSGGFEWSVGTALHAARLPLRGLFLSSTQAAVMVFAGAGLGRRSRVVWVPFIAAGIKALSPAGTRVRAMLAITIQGLLFGGGIRTLGWNALGIFVAGALVGSWATLQGLLLQYLLVGSDLLRAYEAVIHWLEVRGGVTVPGLAILLSLWVGAWGLVSGSAALLAWRRGALPLRLRQALDRGAEGLRWEDPAPSWSSAIARGGRDILRPVFWIPVAVVILILLSAGAPWERAFWIGARALTIGIVLFSLIRAFDVQGFLRWLRRRGHWGPAVAFERATRR